MLPAQELERFFAFQLAGHDTRKWRQLCEECDELQITEAYGMLRTAKYLSEEKQ